MSGRPHLPPHYRVQKGPAVALVAAVMLSGLANAGNAQGAKKLSASSLRFRGAAVALYRLLPAPRSKRAAERATVGQARIAIR